MSWLSTRLLLPLLVAIVVAAGGCEVDTAPDSLRRTPQGDGPTVKFDLVHRPLPEIPLPNDVATFADPTSRTGRRVNVSLVAPTHMERVAREAFSTMEGWGVTSPITVSFERGAGADPREAALDLDDLASRMQGDEHDLSNDPLYLVNLRTGVPVFLDVGSGAYPLTVRDPFRYFPNDPKAKENNLTFETTEEGAGLPQQAYRPDLDRDFDGVLDHPNTLGSRGLGDRGIPGVDDVMSWYERETDTLVLRPLLPLEEKTEYAVVLTDRLRGSDRRTVRSPFEAIHHPAQRAGIGRLQDVLRDKGRSSAFGDLAGTGLEHVAFAWTFTTQPTHEDMRLLRDGLYGKGPFARFAKEFPADLVARQVAGIAPYGEEQPPGWQTTPGSKCGERAKTPYIVRTGDPDIKESFRLFFENLFGLSAGELAALQSSFEYIDHVVVGTFRSPFLLGDPKGTDPDSRFHLDFQTGRGDVRADDVGWLLVVPKSKTKRLTPFPVAFWGHGVTGNSTEPLFYAGDYARQGIALFAYNNPEHGLVLDARDADLASAVLVQNCLTPFLGAFSPGRARDVNGDGLPDSGAFWWTSHIFHTRDNVRQGILDGMQALRALRTFDGHVGAQDYDQNGTLDVDGDFDLDGIPDVGGPNVPYFAAGESLGGIMSGIQGGIEPYMIAAAPMSGGGALAMDVAMRSYGVVESVTSQMMGPVIVALPAAERPETKDTHAMASRCALGDRSVRIVVNDAVDNHELEIACLTPGELGPSFTVVVSNVTSGEARCARTEADGRFRVPVPTSTGDRLDIQLYAAPDVVDSYATCAARPDATAGRRIATWEQPATMPLAVADDEKTRCDDSGSPEGAKGCQQFRDVFYPVGSPLVAPNEGLGLRRQSPALRRFRDLGQAAFDPADPAVFAPYYMLKPLLDENGVAVPPHALLNINTVGDNFVQVAAGLTFARAAGVLPFLPPSAAARYPEHADYVTPADLYEQLGRRTPMQVLVDNGVAEGIARLGRTHAGPACTVNYARDPALCKSPPALAPAVCENALYDADWVSEGRMPYDQPHAETPLRLARIAGARVTDPSSLAAAWEPRLRGAPFTQDGTAWSARERVVALLNHYLVPEGKHTWDVPDACRAWDFAVYGNALTARFFATEGRDVYYLSHPQTHGCLADGSCEFLR